MTRITNNDLNDIKNITLKLKNGDAFHIAVNDILAINFDNIEDTGDGCYCCGSYNKTMADDGMIIVSKNAFKHLGEISKCQLADGTTLLDNYPIESFYFYERVKDCCDICEIAVEFKVGNNLLFRVPFKPLEEYIHGYEVELSNCPSCELTENGDLLILFGKSSKSYKRIDNNYNDLIFGLHESIKQPVNDILEIKVNSISKDYGKFFSEICLNCQVLNDGFDNVNLELHFLNVSKVAFETTSYEEQFKQGLLMSKMGNNRIFVQIGNFFTFQCAVVVNKKYISALSNRKDIAGTVIEKCINCQLVEEEMKVMAYNAFALDRSLDLDAVYNAFEKVENGTINISYFRYWLLCYGDLLNYNMAKNVLVGKRVAREMFRLYLNIFYEPDTNNCMDKIKATLDKIIELCK
ncbi:MAG: hypothetical protein IJZ29_03015 [Clostridia bacterium]|nr:hypothetical protein [Clostridia bacterium]